MNDLKGIQKNAKIAAVLHYCTMDTVQTKTIKTICKAFDLRIKNFNTCFNKVKKLLEINQNSIQQEDAGNANEESKIV